MIHKSWDIYRKNELDETQSTDSNYHHQVKIMNYLYSFLGILAVSIMLGYLIYNYHSIIKVFQYEFTSRFGGNSSTIQQQMGMIAEADIFSEKNNNLLSIPKIELSAQITWDVSSSDLNEQSDSTICHLMGSSKPNVKTGNIILFGKSSSSIWKNASYGSVFALLNYLNREDRIDINFEDNYYVYTVIDKKIIKSSEFNNFLSNLDNQSNNLILVTSWPLGTSLNKLIINAKLSSTSQKNLINP